MSKQRSSHSKNESTHALKCPEIRKILEEINRCNWMQNFNEYLCGPDVPNPLIETDLDKVLGLLLYSKNDSSSEVEVSCNYKENQLFYAETKVSDQLDPKTAGEDPTTEWPFSSHESPKENDLPSNTEAYQPKKKNIRKSRITKKSKQPATMIPKAKTKNAFQNFKLPIVKYLKQFSKKSLAFTHFEKEKTVNSIGIFENLLKEETHAKDIAFMFQHRCLKFAFMNGRSDTDMKVNNFSRIRELKRRFLKLQGQLEG